jgi:hypothetical protein
VTANAEVASRPVQLQCYNTHSSCVVPPSDTYEMRRLEPGHGDYMDCPNVELYSLDGSGRTGNIVGQYCLIGEK